MYDKIVIVVKKTAQEELVEKMGNIGQAQYMLRQAMARHAPKPKDSILKSTIQKM